MHINIISQHVKTIVVQSWTPELFVLDPKQILMLTGLKLFVTVLMGVNITSYIQITSICMNLL